MSSGRFGDSNDSALRRPPFPVFQTCSFALYSQCVIWDCGDALQEWIEHQTILRCLCADRSSLEARRRRRCDTVSSHLKM